MHDIISNLLDHLYATVANRQRFFSEGVGDEETLAWAMRPEPGAVAALDVVWAPWVRERGLLRRRGAFASPLMRRLPVPAGVARVELVAPESLYDQMPVCVHLAATGDEGFDRRRRLFARPLARRGIASLILENPFYGSRRVTGRGGRAPGTVADLALMARATVEEAVAILSWLRRSGHRVVGVSGVSMGGQMAALAAASVSFPLAAIPCLPSRTPASVFLDGLLSRVVDWPALEHDWGPGARQRLRETLLLGDVCALPPPLHPGAAIIVAARRDRYVPLADPRAIQRHWPGSELRLLDTGHVGAVLLHSRRMVEGVVDAFDRMRLLQVVDEHAGGSASERLRGRDDDHSRRSRRLDPAGGGGAFGCLPPILVPG
jgi:dienelactone hydrolase